MSGYTDVGLGKWYDDAIAKCISAGIMEGYGNGIMDPNGFITREMFFVMFCRALGIKPVDTTEISINDASDVSDYAKGYIKALVNKGYVQGTDSTEDGIVVEPKLNINRASVMSLMDKTIKTYVNTTEKVTAKDGLTLIVVDNANVTFANNTKDAEVYVFGKNTAITNAPVGTKVITSENATGTNVNGKSFSKNTTTIVKKSNPSGGGSYTPPAPTTYTVTFDMQGHGEQIAALTGLSSGAKVTKPTDPTAAGFIFDGWYKEAACETAWNFSADTVMAATTLYAKWTAKDTAIEEAVVDGTEIKADGEKVTVTSGDDKSAATLDAAQATELAGKINDLLENSAVANFKDDKLEESTQINTTGLEYIIAALKDAATDPTAKGNLDGKTSADVDLQIKVVLSSVNIKSTEDMTVTSMEFDVTPIATTTVKDSSGKTVSVSADIKSCLNTEVTFRLPIDSSLKEIGNTIAIYHEGEFLGNYEIKGDTPNTYIEIQSKDFSKYGYQLLNAGNAGAKIVVGETPTYYFNFTDAVAKVADGQTITLLKPATGTVEIAKEISFTVNKNGKEFNATVSAGTNFVLQNTDLAQATITYKCFPDDKQFTVTFDLNGITGTAPDPQTVTYGAKLSKPADPADNDHTFVNWYKTKDQITGALSDPWNFDTDTVSGTATLYAQWTRTMQSILATNEGIPEATDLTPPSTAWVKSTDPDCKAFIGVDAQGDKLFVVMKLGSDHDPFGICMNDTFEKIDGNTYKYDDQHVTVTVTMTDSKFTSCELVFKESQDKLFDGTYTAPETKKLYEILPSGFPETADSAWVIADGKKAYKDGENIMVGSLTLGKDVTVTKSGDNYVCKSGDATVTFNVKDGAVKSITVSGSNDSDGTYTALTFKAVYNTKDDANTLTFYYDSKDHSGEGITVYEDGTTNYLFDNSKSNGAIWGYNGNRGSITSVVIDVSVADYKGLTSTAYMFQGMQKAENISGTENLDTSKVTDMKGMFAFCKVLSSLDLSKFDTSKATDMQSMFNNCNELSSLDLSNFNTSEVTNMSSMFLSCKKLTSLDITSFNTKIVQNMNSMFKECSALETITFGNSFNTSNVTDMGDMFNGCTNLQSLDLSKFSTSQVIKMTNMFQNCGTLTTLDLSSFDTSKVTNMTNMFKDCSKLTSVKISPENEKIAEALGGGWNYNEANGAYEVVSPTTTVSDVLSTAGTNAPSNTEYWYGANITNKNTCEINSNFLEFKGTSGQISIPVSTSVTAAGDNYTCSTDDGVITFIMTNKALTSIAVSNCKDGNAVLNDTYKVKIVKDVIETAADDFSKGTESWQYEEYPCYVNVNLRQLLIDYNGGSNPYVLANLERRVALEGNNWTCSTNEGKIKITFNMNEGALISITVSGCEVKDGALNGTYVPKK